MPWTSDHTMRSDSCPPTRRFSRNHIRAGLAVAAAAGLVLTGCGGVQNSTGGGGGDSYPSGAVEMYVGASAGGSSDLISRAVSKGLSDDLGASFPVINREGANGALAAAEVAKAEPDGSMIAIQNASLFTITPLAVGPDEVTNIDDFDVVQGVSRDDYVLVTNPASGFRTLDDIKNADQRRPLRHDRRRHRRATVGRPAVQDQQRERPRPSRSTAARPRWPRCSATRSTWRASRSARRSRTSSPAS